MFCPELSYGGAVMHYMGEVVSPLIAETAREMCPCGEKVVLLMVEAIPCRRTGGICEESEIVPFNYRREAFRKTRELRDQQRFVKLEVSLQAGNYVGPRFGEVVSIVG